jgi:hypothetical protein
MAKGNHWSGKYWSARRLLSRLGIRPQDYSGEVIYSILREQNYAWSDSLSAWIKSLADANRGSL